MGVCGGIANGGDSSSGWLFATERLAKESHKSSSSVSCRILPFAFLGGSEAPGEAQPMKAFARELPQLPSGSKALRRRAMTWGDVGVERKGQNFHYINKPVERKQTNVESGEWFIATSGCRYALVPDGEVEPLWRDCKLTVATLKLVSVA